MREGTINCKCGNAFWISAASNSTACPNCGEAHNIEHLPNIVKQEDPPKSEKQKVVDDLKAIFEQTVSKIMSEGEPDGTAD